MRRPRIGFLGTGWIGRHRMQAMLETGAVDAVAIVDPDPDSVAQASRLAPSAEVLTSLEDLFSAELDGIVVATPSALHGEQSIAALRRGRAVFCQKPLARSPEEAACVVQAAADANRLLSVDFSYRHTAATDAIHTLVQQGELGEVFAIDLIFHNAYGPDKPWFYDRRQSGGGCVMDLGVHLIDLALWLTGFPAVQSATSRLYAGGKLLGADPEEVEDYATARIDLATGTTVSLACSWRLNAGREAVIEVHLHGSKGGATLCNVGGSFYDFEAWRHDGTRTECLTSPPDQWGGRAAAAWALRLARDARFDPDAWQLVRVSDAVRQIYASAAGVPAAMATAPA